MTKWRRRGVARMAGALAGAAAGAATWPAARGAWAGDEWCDTDPIRLITTPRGATVAVYYLTGVKGTLGVVGSLLSHLAVQHTAVPENGGTKVTLSVTVPNGLLGATYETRLTCSSGALGTGTVYGRTYGTTGVAMTLEFHLDVA